MINEVKRYKFDQIVLNTRNGINQIEVSKTKWFYYDECTLVENVDIIIDDGSILTIIGKTIKTERVSKWASDLIPLETVITSFSDETGINVKYRNQDVLELKEQKNWLGKVIRKAGKYMKGDSIIQTGIIEKTYMFSNWALIM